MRTKRTGPSSGVFRKTLSLNQCCNKDFLANQDKGSISAAEEVLDHAAQFNCAFHCHQNIIKTCGGGKGEIPNSALWVSNILHFSNLVVQLELTKKKYYNLMHPTDRLYLTKIPDKCQYPAARCAIGENICMFNKSASFGVESLNRANQLA
jgi:hypothetical protein